MEWLTSMVVLKFLKEVCEKIKNKQCFCGIDLEKKFDEKGLVIIPCLNPDGVDISLQGPAAAGNFYRFVEMSSRGKSKFWQANARGVDLNHNYSAGWNELHRMEIKNGIIKSLAQRDLAVHGLLANLKRFILTNFCKKNNVSSAIAFHSQGEEIYWNFGPKTPKNSLEIAEVLAVAFRLHGQQTRRPCQLVEALKIGSLKLSVSLRLQSSLARGRTLFLLRI